MSDMKQYSLYNPRIQSLMSLICNFLVLFLIMQKIDCLMSSNVCFSSQIPLINVPFCSTGGIFVLYHCREST